MCPRVWSSCDPGVTYLNRGELVTVMTIQHKYCCSMCPYVSRQLSPCTWMSVDMCYLRRQTLLLASQPPFTPGRLHFPNKSQRHFHSHVSSQSLATEPSRCGISVPALDLGRCDLLYKEKDTEGGELQKATQHSSVSSILGGVPAEPRAMGSRKPPSMLEAGRDQAQRYGAAPHPLPPAPTDLGWRVEQRRGAVQSPAQVAGA